MIISIHALRVEGDRATAQRGRQSPKFLSTPSGWRATADGKNDEAQLDEFLSTPSGWRATAVTRSFKDANGISIHALRVEGDLISVNMSPPWLQISIHALRVEGDRYPLYSLGRYRNFYPRPPGGGRLPYTQHRGQDI